MAEKEKPEAKKSLVIPDRTVRSIENTLKALVNVQLEWNPKSCGSKLIELDVPRVKGYLNVKIGLIETPGVLKPDEMICVGHVALQ